MVSVLRYAVLVGDAYYPSGWSDYQNSFDDLSVAVAHGVAMCDNSNGLKWYEVVDLSSMTVVEKG